MEATTLFTLPFLVLFFTTKYGVYASRGISIPDNKPPAVLDIYGNEVQVGEYYYLIPALRLPRFYTAAIVPGIYRNATTWFQLEITKCIYGIEGLPVTFLPTNLTEDASIHVSTDLNIRLYPNKVIRVLGKSPVWKVQEEPERKKFVTLGGAEGDKRSCFKIKKASEIGNRTYKLVSCCGRDVGISNISYDTKLLALAEPALRFYFQPAKDGLATSK